jgi:hypothetical protein
VLRCGRGRVHVVSRRQCAAVSNAMWASIAGVGTKRSRTRSRSTMTSLRVFERERRSNLEGNNRAAVPKGDEATLVESPERSTSMPFVPEPEHAFQPQPHLLHLRQCTPSSANACTCEHCAIVALSKRDASLHRWCESPRDPSRWYRGLSSPRTIIITWNGMIERLDRDLP